MMDKQLQVSVTNGVITLTLNDLSTVNVTGNVQGADGADGATGPRTMQGATEQQVVQQLYNPIREVANAGDLWYDTDDTIHTFTLVVFGSQTDNPQTLSLAGNVITISGSNSNVDLTGVLGA